MDLTAFPGRNGTGHSEVPYSAFADPCVNHTVLDQAWRSIDCGLLECLIGLICDESLQQGWYRFNSFGGWKIPEIVIPLTNCSSWSTGWLNGRHPTVMKGEVTRTVCFNWFANSCYRKREIQIKNCSSFFVYELKPAPFCPAACCTASEDGQQESWPGAGIGLGRGILFSYGPLGI
ncbi:uromodulin-like isoform X2 [Stegostoma tigrinum]|uniref:uromodulin-like isoform X2 n=1 Tax=Stegostoma tigrinum TaxID=3053191 RepID=UPI00286FE0BF|nr:uromodulin-like isoform X2 [Stegostoma tigrinum]